MHPDKNQDDRERAQKAFDGKQLKDPIFNVSNIKQTKSVSIEILSVQVNVSL